MKKWMISSLILIVMMVVAAGVYAQTTDKEKKPVKKECAFVDQDKDGKCDTCGKTADECKKACTAQESKDCSKCPSTASCTETKAEAIPATEGTGTKPACCAGKK
ncbi:MAG: hypothetical protein WCD55_14155 [Bacteroidales bacterium]